MNISIVNHTGGKISDADLQQAIRAINRQIEEDFYPYWGMSARLRLEGRSVEDPNAASPADLRGDAIIYLWNEADVPNAIGYHERNGQGIPFGFVFIEIAETLGEPWTATLSHEALELIADPETNLLVMGPHPTDQGRDVFHWFEMCDAVQDTRYIVDGIAVSNFVLPLYFTGTRETDEVGARNDFLGTEDKGQTLRSFGINPGGYIGFFEPTTGKHETFAIVGDNAANRRLQIKASAKQSRRAIRYSSFQERSALRVARTAQTTSAESVSSERRAYCKIASEPQADRAPNEGVKHPDPG